MGEGISDYTKFIIDLRRHMWKSGVEIELRRLIWQIAVIGKYISAKIQESNRKLAGFRNIRIFRHGEEQLTMDRSADEILKSVEEMWDQWDSQHPVTKAAGKWHWRKRIARSRLMTSCWSAPGRR